MRIKDELAAVHLMWHGEYPDVPCYRQAIRIPVLDEGPRREFRILVDQEDCTPCVQALAADGSTLGTVKAGQDGSGVRCSPFDPEQGVVVKIDEQLAGRSAALVLTLEGNATAPYTVVVLQQVSADQSVVIYNSHDRLGELRESFNRRYRANPSVWTSAWRELLEALLAGNLETASRYGHRLHGSAQGRTLCNWLGQHMGIEIAPTGRVRLADLPKVGTESSSRPTRDLLAVGMPGSVSAEEWQSAEGRFRTTDVSEFALEHLLRGSKGLETSDRDLVETLIRGGRLNQAADVLWRYGAKIIRSGGMGPLLLYIYQLGGLLNHANALSDSLLGVDLSRNLAMEKCPSEDVLMARWTRPTEEGVSIICTTFNHERFLSMALSGFFSQVTTHPFEVVVRDDASTDGTAEILSQWKTRYPRLLRVVRMERNTYQQGIPPMPAALEHARYPLVALCEGDDFWVDPGKVELQANLLVQNPGWSAITHNHYELDETNCSLAPGRPTTARGVLPRKDLLLACPCLWIHTLMFRRSRLNLPHYSLRDHVLGDQVFTSSLGAGGSVYFVGDLFGSVARRNLFSTFTPLSNSEKTYKRVQTRVFLSRMLSERGETELAQMLHKWCESAQRLQPGVKEKETSCT